jgi:hypothetical protein
MTNKEILQKAIDKAIKGGYVPDDVMVEGRENFSVYSFLFMESKSYYSYIFSHDFAKAFWGTDRGFCPVCGIVLHHQVICSIQSFNKMGWQHHLQQMVLEEDPIKYLEKFL